MPARDADWPSWWVGSVRGSATCRLRQYGHELWGPGTTSSRRSGGSVERGARDPSSTVDGAELDDDGPTKYDASVAVDRLAGRQGRADTGSTWSPTRRDTGNYTAISAIRAETHTHWPRGHRLVFTRVGQDRASPPGDVSVDRWGRSAEDALAGSVGPEYRRIRAWPNPPNRRSDTRFIRLAESRLATCR